MGMELQSHWTCDRCDTIEFVELGVAPSGWQYVARADLFIDAEDNLVDHKIPHANARKVLCASCVGSYKEWLGVNDEPPTPVVVAEQEVPEEESETRVIGSSDGAISFNEEDLHNDRPNDLTEDEIRKMENDIC